MNSVQTSDSDSDSDSDGGSDSGEDNSGYFMYKAYCRKSLQILVVCTVLHCVVVVCGGGGCMCTYAAVVVALR